MSTASPLPLQPLPPPTLSQADARALKQQVSSRLMEHRQRRPRAAESQPALPMEGFAPAGKSRRVADSVAARFAQSVTYREFLEAEAQAAVRKAEATVEVARRTADAVAAAQQQLLCEMEQWNASVEADAPAVPLGEVELPLAAVLTEPRAAHVPQASIFGSYADVQPSDPRSTAGCNGRRQNPRLRCPPT